MLERLFVTLILVVVGTGGFVVFRHWHVRRANRATRPGLVGTSGPALLYFRSDHCAPCATQARYLHEVKRDYGGWLAIEEIDAEAESDRAARYGVFTLPTTLIVDPQGQVKHINYGLATATKLARQLESIV